MDILLVDDEPTIRLSVGDALTEAGHRVTLASDGAQALELARSRRFDVVVTDIGLPKVDGLTVFRTVKQESPGTDVILITAYAAVADAVEALKDGAHDYLTKPFDVDELVVRVGRLGDRHALNKELAAARAMLAARETARAIIGKSAPMLRLLDRIDALAGSDANVLIQGESGTGKELVARRIHDLSPRAAAPFVAVHCAAFPETLIEAELFGHERGAFTGAIKKRDGRFKVADGGTLFLDEVGEIPLPAQAKLLRVLQDGVIEPLGTSTSVKVDVRVLCATHRNLKECVSKGTFREDLYYRLNVLDVIVPPLRDRRGDLPILVEYFLQRFAPDPDRRPPISPRAWAAISNYAFPGNVRELEHAIQHAVVLARGREIDLEHMPRDIVGSDVEEAGGSAESIQPLGTALKAFEKEYLLRALRLADGRKLKAAEMLGISRKNLWEKLRAHELGDDELGDLVQ